MILLAAAYIRADKMSTIFKNISDNCIEFKEDKEKVLCRAFVFKNVCGQKKENIKNFFCC